MAVRYVYFLKPHNQVYWLKNNCVIQTDVLLK